MKLGEPPSAVWFAQARNRQMRMKRARLERHAEPRETIRHLSLHFPDLLCAFLDTDPEIDDCNREPYEDEQTVRRPRRGFCRAGAASRRRP